MNCTISLAKAQESGRARSEMQIRILVALAYAAQDSLPQAKQDLIQALSSAQHEGYRRLF